MYLLSVVVRQNAVEQIKGVILGKRAFDFQPGNVIAFPVNNEPVRTATNWSIFAKDKSHFLYGQAGYSAKLFPCVSFQSLSAVRVKIAFKGNFIRAEERAA